MGMPTEPDAPPPPHSQAAAIGRAFGKLLNSHGYPFQYASIASIGSLYNRGSAWLFEASEFPVEARGKGAAADFILKHVRTQFRLIVECKRVNPALADWCFAKASYVRRGDDPNEVVIERITNDGTGVAFSSVAHRWKNSDRIYHIGMEVRSRSVAGEPDSQGRRAINDAVEQVLRAVNGLVDYVDGKANLVVQYSPWFLMPVVLTTARLWTSDVDLSSANLASGQLDLSKVSVAPADWLFLNYNVSPGLRHSAQDHAVDIDLSGVLHDHFIRSVALVSVDGIGAFLAHTSQ